MEKTLRKADNCLKSFKGIDCYKFNNIYGRKFEILIIDNKAELCRVYDGNK